jgi:hypothetical protein
MVSFDDYLKQQRDLYEAATKPYREFTHLQRAYEDALKPYRHLQEMINVSSVAREALRYQEWQEQLIREMRPVLADVNVTSRIAAAMLTPPALSLLEQQRRLVSELTVPAAFQSTIGAISTFDRGTFRYTSEIQRLLEELRPYADVAPAVPDDETLAACASVLRR